MAVLALVACSSGNDPVNSPSGGSVGLQGAYTGTTAGNLAFDTLVLDGGRFYVIYGQRDDTNGNLLVNGFIEGNGTSNNGSFSSTNAKDFSENLSTPATISVSYGTGTGITGNIEVSQTPVVTDSFSAVPITSGYNYGSAAVLSDIAGNWQLAGVNGETATVAIATDGTLTADANGCSVSGNVKPRASGRNVFDVNLSFGPSPCVLANQAATGNAISYLLTNGSRQLIIAGTNTARDAGTAMFGVR